MDIVIVIVYMTSICAIKTVSRPNCVMKP